MLDVQTEIHEALWDLLEANSDFTTRFKTGNRIKDSTDLPVIAAGIKIRPDDYPKIALSVTGENNNDRTVKTFGMQDQATHAAMDYDIPMTITAEIKVEHSERALQSEVGADLTAIRGAILKKGKSLGLNWVRTHRTQIKTSRKPANKTKMIRPVTSFTLIIDAAPRF